MAARRKPANTPAPAVPPLAQESGVRYLVNPAGVVHSCDEEHFQWRIRLPHWREATADEITEYHASKRL
jgi:hypothetical protein